MSGWVEEILISAHAVEPPYAVERARAIAGIGLEGDRYFAGVGTWSNYPVPTGKDLTLIEAEVLEAVGLSGTEARRNVVTRGIRLNELVGRRFRVGEVECYGDRLCAPRATTCTASCTRSRMLTTHRRTRFVASSDSSCSRRASSSSRRGTS